VSFKPIKSLAELHNYLHATIQLEHATIPPYLTALYSIWPGKNSAAVHILRAVLVEEMLHLTLAANVLNAVGGTPDLTQASFVPVYPAYLPDGEKDFQVSRQRFCRQAVETFLKIERPARAPNEQSQMVRRKRSSAAILSMLPDNEKDIHYYSIGEFYQAISQGITYLEGEKSRCGETLFIGDRARQVTREYYFSGGGEVMPVVDLPSALAALRLIIEQGEGGGDGAFDYEHEISHYYRFEQLLLGRYYQTGDQPGCPSGEPILVDWDAVYPMQDNVGVADYPQGSELHTAAREFNAFYYKFLQKLTRAYSGHPELLMAAVGDMFRIKEHATALIRNPIPGQAQNAGPTFELDEYAPAVAPAEGDLV